MFKKKFVKVSNGRLGSLHFREDCIVTTCQEDYICIWIRPNSQHIQQVNYFK